MKKYFLLLILLFAGVLNAQSLKFALITDVPQARRNPEFPVDSIKAAMASFGAGGNLICSGNLTLKGSADELIEAKSYLDSLSTSCAILAGKNDFTQFVSSLINLQKFISGDNFAKQFGDYLFIGIQSISLVNNNYSYISKETLEWAAETGAQNKDKKIILFLNSTPEKTGNFYQLADVLKDNQVNLILTSEFQIKKQKEPVSKKRVKQEKKPEAIPYFYGFELRNDSLFIYSYFPNEKFVLADTRITGKIDLASLNPGPAQNEALPVLFTTKISIYAPILQYKDNLIAGTMDGKVISFNPDYTIKWTHQLTGSIVSAPVAAEDHIIAASTKGDIIILEPGTKTEVQSIGIDCEIVSPLTVIDYKGNKELLIPKSTSSIKALVFGGVNGEIYCYDLETLQQLWVNNDSRSPIVQNVIDTGNKLFFKNGEGYVFCLDNKTGQLIWKWNYKEIFADVKTPLFSTGKHIITLSNKNTFVGIDLLLGVAEWESEKDDIKSIFIGKNDLSTIYALGDKKIEIFEARKGQLKNEIKLKEKGITSFLFPNGDTDKYLLTSDDNTLYKTDKTRQAVEIGNSGRTPIVSIFEKEKDEYLILNSDGQLLKLNSNKK